MPDTAARFAPTAGTTLPHNGATILRSYQDTNDCVVLCRTLKGELATWRVDHEGNAVWGNYFKSDDLPKAIKNFFARVNEHNPAE